MDDILINDGAAFNISTPVEQKNEEQTEKSKVLMGIPLLEEIINRLDLRIKFYDSLEAIPEEVLNDARTFMNTVAANKQTIKNLIIEKDYLEGLVSMYAS